MLISRDNFFLGTNEAEIMATDFDFTLRKKLVIISQRSTHSTARTSQFYEEPKYGQWTPVFVWNPGKPRLKMKPSETIGVLGIQSRI